MDELLSPASVSVWLLASQQPESVLAELVSTLDSDERARADEVTDPGRRADFITGHGVARLILSGLLGVSPAALRWRHGRHGKPELAYPESELCCNLSHSAGMVAFAVTRNRPVGIDVEQWRPGVEINRMAARYYPASEAEFVAAAGTGSERSARFTDLWCRKEACAKAAGGRLFPALRLPAHRPDGAPEDLTVLDPDGLTGPFLVRDLPAPAGFSAALAVAGTAGFDVVYRRWSPATGQLSLQESNRTAVAQC